MIWNDRNELIAILPGMASHDIFFSHKGISFGGFAFHPKVKSAQMETIFGQTARYLKYNGLEKCWYRPQPSWYHPTADGYFLFKAGARIADANLSYVIDMTVPLNFNSNRKRNLKKVQPLLINDSSKIESFYEMLTNELSEKYNAKPVHTLEELKTLMRYFPDNIKLFSAQFGSNEVGHILVFLFNHVIKCQYIISNPLGNQLEAITQLISFLFQKYNKSHVYLDLGTASTSTGDLNDDLVRFKESVGGKPMPILTYELNL